MPAVSQPSLSHPAFWRDHVLHVLATQGAYTAGVIIERESVISAALRLARVPLNSPLLYDRQEPHTDPKKLGMYNRVPGLRRVIGTAYQSLWYSKVLGGAKPGALVSTLSEGSWSLTPDGVLAAYKVRWRFVPGLSKDANLTATWIAMHSEAIWKDATVFLSRHFKNKREIEEIPDHIGAYITTSVRCDSFASRIAEGKPPTTAQVSSWIYTRAASHWRDGGQDAHVRATRGALTARERDAMTILDPATHRGATASAKSIDAAKKVMVRSVMPSDFVPVLDVEQSTATGAPVIVDMVDRMGLTPEDILIEREAAERGFARIEEVIRKKKAGAPDRYVEVFRRAREGVDRDGLAQLLGVSPNRAATILTELRVSLREAYDDGELDDAKELLSKLM